MQVDEFLNLKQRVDSAEAHFREMLKDECSIYEFQLLNFLRDGEMNLKQLSGRRYVNQQGIGRLCKNMEGRGLININVHKRDKREKLVSLTAKGKTVEEKARGLLSGVL